MKASIVEVFLGVSVASLAGWFVWLAACHDIEQWRKQASKRYTVHAASGEYQDLQRITTRTHWAKYKRPTGEAIIFNGDFTEIEQ